MNRFAKLTRLGTSLYIDPELVGAVVLDGTEQPTPTHTALVARDNSGILVDRIEETTDEAYRRLAAAADRLTLDEFEAVTTQLTVAAVTGVRGAMHNIRTGSFTTEEAVTEAFKAVAREWLRGAREAVLKTAYVAEGKEPKNG